jgi:DNA-binding transcriptional LysR family regulator
LELREVFCAGDLQDDVVFVLVRASGLRNLVKQAFERDGATYMPPIEVRHCVTACALVEHGLGLAVVDEFSAAPANGWQLEIRRFTPVVSITACVMYLKQKPLSRLASRFIEELRKANRTM